MSVEPQHQSSEAIPIQVCIDNPSDCPVATASSTSEATATNVGICERSIQTGEIVGEFTLDADSDPDGDFERIRSGQRGAVYRFNRTDVTQCPCEVIEKHGIPVTDVSAQSGTLLISFNAEPNVAKEVLRQLASQYESLQVRYPEIDPTEASYGLIDLSTLTARQHEVLRAAYELGYFDFPKRANAGDVAEDLGIARSTFTEHLSAAQRKVFGSLFEA